MKKNILLSEQVKNTCDDYYPSLAEGNIVLHYFGDDTDVDAIASALDCEKEEAEELISSGLVNIQDFTTENPENENHTLYLKVLNYTGMPVYFEE